MKRTMQILVVTAGIILCLTGLASAAEKSVILGFHEKPGPSEQALIHGAKGIIKKTFNLIPAMAVSLPEEEIAALKQNSRVAYINEDAIFTAVEPVVSDEYINSWGVYRIFSDVAHFSGNKGAGVNIGVLDAGIDYTHPELVDNYKGGYDFVYNDNDPFESYNSHGTHVAGIIAAEENGVGVIGVAPEANIYAVKILDSGGFGLLSWVLSGIQWAVSNEMDIVNMSFEGMDSESLKAACDAAYESGVLLVAAAGNLSPVVRFPAAYDSVIAVTATDVSDMQAFPPQGPEVELAAPGVDILSACTLSNPACASGGYQVLSGTSQAAPHVTGTAALLFGSVGDLNKDGVIDNVDVRQALQMSSIDLGLEGRDDVFGFGLVNAASASFNTDFSFTITKTSGAPHRDSETVHLDGAPYEIHIANNNLSKVEIDVFEGTSLLRELSSSYSFNNNSPQEVMFILDATGRRYDVKFTPYGKSGNSMNIMINMQGK
ncbi:MAG: hypothetical protein E4H43_01560 [Bacteroidia bacterium]|nr:MAG: hypothetical protein E4H43_01560 [Bacteroidia bacterium]